MATNNKAMGHRLKEFREYLRLSQTDFGAPCGIIQKTISTMEAGNSFPVFKNVKKVCEAYPQLNSDWLMFGRGSMLISNQQNGLASYNKTGISSDGQEDKPTMKIRAKEAFSEGLEEIRSMYENAIIELRADKSFLQEQLSKP